MDAYANAYRLSLESKAYAAQSIAYRVASLRHFITWCEARGIVRIEGITRPVLPMRCPAGGILPMDPD